MACASEPVLLNSERIERRFGSYGIEVLASEAGLRRSSLYSEDGSRRICRTYAVVRFADQLHDRYGTEHGQVLAGNSIGAIFKAHGWNVHKQTLYIGELGIPAADTSITRLMQISGAPMLALHVYQLLLVKDDEVYEYATILETHHPEYLSASDLHELYDYDATNTLSPGELSKLYGLILSDYR